MQQICLAVFFDDMNRNPFPFPGMHLIDQHGMEGKQPPDPQKNQKYIQRRQACRIQRFPCKDTPHKVWDGERLCQPDRQSDPRERYRKKHIGKESDPVRIQESPDIGNRFFQFMENPCTLPVQHVIAIVYLGKNLHNDK